MLHGGMNSHPLTEARRRANLSQQALADLIEKDRITILRIEKGERTSLDTVAKIITALRARGVELSADEFMGNAA